MYMYNVQISHTQYH